MFLRMRHFTEQELLQYFQGVAGPHVYFAAVDAAQDGQCQYEVDDAETDSYCDCGEEQHTDNEWEHAQC